MRGIRSLVGLRRKRCPVTLTRTVWVQFLPAPTHETCLCCSAKSGLMKLACIQSNRAISESILNVNISFCTLRNIFIRLWARDVVPHPRAQLVTYDHLLQPSPLFADLSQKAPGKSADSRSMAKGIVPVAPTSTRGRRPNMEDSGITDKTYACSRLSRTIADCH